jgi:heme oxygenase
MESHYDLLLEMRKATRRQHHVANALILAKLVVVLTDQKLYAKALASFLPVYSKLEQLMKQHADAPGLQLVVSAVQNVPSRAEAMKEDLQHLLGKGWQSTVPASTPAKAYADHLQTLADRDPVLLLPYVFSMHIPILLGFLAQRIQRTLQLPDKQGLAFFTVSVLRGALMQVNWWQFVATTT